jgi:hypothetical protein
MVEKRCGKVRAVIVWADSVGGIRQVGRPRRGPRREIKVEERENRRSVRAAPRGTADEGRHGKPGERCRSSDVLSRRVQAGVIGLATVRVRPFAETLAHLFAETLALFGCE